MCVAVPLVQELSSHLAAEITRLCSLAKQDELPLSQEMCVYEMEVSPVCSSADHFTLGPFTLVRQWPHRDPGESRGLPLAVHFGTSHQ